MIETDRLILRKLTLNDMNELIENGNDRELSFLTYYLPYPLGEEGAKKIILEENTNKDLFRFAIELKSIKRLIGIVDLYNFKKKEGKIKIGYWLGKNYRKVGYGVEAVKRIMDFAFEEIGVKKICAKVLIINNDSKKLLEKLGYKQTKITENDKFLDGKKIDTVSYEFTK
jgi:ribosomal-protein-alanine N-acetyltransferase